MPAEKTPERSLHRKLAQIMFEAERIPKRGKAPAAMGGYPFVQVGDAADYIRKALAEHVLTMMPTKVTVVGQVDRPTKAGGSMTTVDLLVEWTITDGESGETHVIESFGAGADGGDKYSGKASTSAMKYALLSGFLLSTGEDTELGTSEAATRAPVDTAVREDVSSSADQAGDGKSKETEEMMGRVRRKGIIRKGTAALFKLTAIQGPDGWQTGFRLEIDKDKAIPQCVVSGPVGHALVTMLGGKPDTLAGTVATVSGLLYNVKMEDKPGSWYRLHVDTIETEDWILPAPVSPDPSAAPVAVGQETLPLTDDEKAAIAGGLA